jgi:hypothetical protein
VFVFREKNVLIIKKLIITLLFKKNANFFAKNWQKSQKIMIITSTPGLRQRDVPRRVRGCHEVDRRGLRLRLLRLGHLRQRRRGPGKGQGPILQNSISAKNLMDSYPQISANIRRKKLRY